MQYDLSGRGLFAFILIGQSKASSEYPHSAPRLFHINRSGRMITRETLAGFALVVA